LSPAASREREYQQGLADLAKDARAASDALAEIAEEERELDFLRNFLNPPRQRARGAGFGVEAARDLGRELNPPSVVGFFRGEDINFAQATDLLTELGEQRRAAETVVNQREVAAEFGPLFGALDNAVNEFAQAAEREGIAIEDATAVWIADAVEAGRAAALRGDRFLARRSLEEGGEALDEARAQVAFDRPGVIAQQEEAFFNARSGRDAEAAREEEIARFMRGAQRAGVVDVVDEAARAFGIAMTEAVVGEQGILSRATIGVAGLRTGGGELARLLSGDDGSRDLIEVGQRTADGIEELVRIAQNNALDLAE
jgi:hypothetical protein